MAIEEQTQSSGYWGIHGEGRRKLGQRLTIPNRKVTKLAFSMSRYGNPHGDLHFNINRVSDDSVIQSKLWDGGAYFVPSTQTWLEVEFDTPVVINEEVRIFASYTGGNTNNHVRLWLTGYDVKAGEYLTYAFAAGWITKTDHDVAYRYTYASTPTATTDPATSVAASSAVLNGKLDSDGGEACDCGFEWGETIGYGNTTPTQSRTTGQTFAHGITGLDPNKTYHFRAFATNSAGTGYGADRTFTTLLGLPTVLVISKAYALSREEL